ncbi:MAG TPA: adenylate kinase [Vicinamibacteria bacterium]|nr:adenylate kinase [Vicinamibacteria bacterium]
MVDASPRAAPAPGVRVIFLGPPGAGKGTQAARMAAHLHVPRISTGDMLREAIAQGTPLGRKAGPLMEKGGLVPDDLLIALIGERLRQPDCARGYILDGFPRTLPQAERLASMVDGQATADYMIFDVEVPRPELLLRLSGRRWCPTCQSTYHVTYNLPKNDSLCDRDGTPLIQREDDKEVAVARRLAEYDERTAPLVDYYRQRSRLHRIDGDRNVDRVFDDLRGILEARS